MRVEVTQGADASDVENGKFICTAIVNNASGDRTPVAIEITVRLPEGWAKVSCPIGLSPGSLKKLSELFDQVLAESRRLSLPHQHSNDAKSRPGNK